jgi:hypothetical protein
MRRLFFLAALFPALAAAQQAVRIEGTAKVRTDPAFVSTVTAVQGGTWTVQPGNTANTTAWVVKIVDGAGSDLDVFKPADLYTAANDHGLLILGQDGGTPARYRSLLMDSTGAIKTDPTGVTTQPVSGTVGITGSVTVTDGAGALNVIVDSGTTTVTQGTASSLKSEVVGTATPSDTFSNPTTAVTGWSLLAGWDDANSRWVRISSDPTNGDDVAVHTTASALDTDAHLRMFDGTNWDRVRGTTGFGLYSDLRGINGVTPLAGNGTTGTGSLRVTMASDTTPFAVKTDQTTHGTTDKVAADLYIGGTVAPGGNGAVTAATPRVTIANDSTGTIIATQGTASSLKVEAVGPVAEAGGASGNPLRMGAVVEVEGAAMTSTNQVDQDISSLKADEEGRLWTRTDHPNPFSCDLSAATGDSAICTNLSSSTTVYVTDIFVSNGSTAGSIIINQGTGTACATNPTAIHPATYLPANSGFVYSPKTPIKITWASGLDICADITSLNPYSVSIRGYYFK